MRVYCFDTSHTLELLGKHIIINTWIQKDEIEDDSQSEQKTMNTILPHQVQDHIIIFIFDIFIVFEYISIW